MNAHVPIESIHLLLFIYLLSSAGSVAAALNAGGPLDRELEINSQMAAELRDGAGPDLNRIQALSSSGVSSYIGDLS